MAGFIPMVSTTPPPIDDDDFGDFMDSSHPEQDDFGDLPSPVNYDDDDDSYPSQSSTPDISNSVGFHSKKGSLHEAPAGFHESKDVESVNDKEVEAVLTKTKPIDSDKIDTGNKFNEDDDRHGPKCHGTIDSEHSPKKNKQLTIPEKIKDSDWIHFECVSQQPNGASDDCVEPVETFPQGSHLVEESPEPVNHLSQNEAGTLAKRNDYNIELPNIECDPVPSTITNQKEHFEAFSEDDMTDNVDEDDQKGLSDDELSSHSKNDSTHEESADEFQVFQSTGINETEPNSETIRCDSYEYEKSNSTELPTEDHLLESKPELSDFPSSKNDSESSENEQISETIGAAFVALKHSESQEVQNSGTKFVALESSESHISLPPPDDSTSVTEVTGDEIQKSVHSDFDIAAGQITNEAEDTNDNFDDEFAEFDSTIMQPSTEAPNQSIQKESDDPHKSEDDGFTAFHTGSNSDEGFADFSNAKSNQGFAEFSTGTEDDDFADFHSGSASTWPSFSSTVTKKATIKDKVAKYISKYSVKDVDASPCDDRTLHLDEQLNTDTLPSSRDSGSPLTVNMESVGIVRPGDLWDQLEDIDNAIALNFLWNGSGHNKHLLDSLGMHTQNILFSGAKQAYYVPTYYAAGLGLLDSNKGILKPMSAAEKITTMFPTDKNIPATTEDLLPEEPHREWKTIADEHGGSRASMNVDGSWLRDDQILANRNGAEFTTENDHVPIISSAMDLDFFDSLPSAGNGAKPQGSTDLIDPELLEFTSAPTTEPPPPPKESGSATLSKILASIKSSNNAQSGSIDTRSTAQDHTKWEEEENKLSAETRSILQKLPNLSYMRAKVLMFPISMSRVNIGDE